MKCELALLQVLASPERKGLPLGPVTMASLAQLRQQVASRPATCRNSGA